MRVLAAWLVLGGPAAADVGHVQDEFERCLGGGDAIFEQSLRGVEDTAEAARMVSLYATATADCSMLALDLCVLTDPEDPCFGIVVSWIESHRVEIAERLPDEIQHDNPFTERRYDRLRETAGNAPCAAATLACFEAEFWALDAAYGAWRMARRAGVMPLVGHGPIDMETLR